MNISKLCISQIQIDSAIDHFFNDKNYVCAITLSGAAEEILGHILRTTGHEHILSAIFDENDGHSFSRFSSMVNEVRNELKHSHDNPDPHHKVKVTEADAGRMLMRAINNFQRVAKNHSENMEKFYEWFSSNPEKILSEWEKT